jgi:hypothetical protein
VKKHGKTNKSSKRDTTIAKQLSRMEVQREAVLSNCLYLSDSCVSNFVRRNLHIKTGIHAGEYPPVNGVHEKAGYTQMDIARCKMFAKNHFS